MPRYVASIWANKTLLEVSGLSCGYADSVVVRDVSFAVEPGQTLAILGANGAGKTSTLMCLAGLVERKTGTIAMRGRDISDLPAEQRIRRGMALVPEGRRVFPDLTVMENLLIGGHVVSRASLDRGIERVLGYFPRLRERRRQLGGSLSGGEQQMLAVGRALVAQPRLLLVDELSLGLMPSVVDECYRVLQRLKQTGVAIVLVEQNTERALDAADQVCVLEAGNLAWQGPAQQARDDPLLATAFLGQTPNGH